MREKEEFQDDYLWDRSGEPDAEIQRLESVMSSLRHDPARSPAPAWPAPTGPRTRWRDWFTMPRLVAALASVALVIAASLLLRPWRQSPRLIAPQAAWEVANLAGAPRIGTNRMGQTGRLRVGEVLETDSDSRANLRVGQIGEVEIEPSTRLRLVAARPTEDRLALDRGTIHALISAPPRLFFVNTPAAVAVDLGCAYTLHVNDRGVGLLRVTFGWVEIETHGQQSLIPSGAAALNKPGSDPGTPYFEDATDAFKAALEKLDFETLSEVDRRQALQTLLAQARKRDGFTLLYLLRSYRGLSESERGLIFDRLAALIPPPAGVVRESMARGNDYMIGLWWDLMGVGHPMKK